MQTFVPEGIKIATGMMELDYRRLGKQRVEAWQILNVLRGVDNDGNPKDPKGWVNHPAVRMWRGYEGGLAIYGWTACSAWIHRGYKDSLRPRFTAAMMELESKMPSWINDESVIVSHRSNLIRKMPEHYGPLWPDVPPDLPYVWPV
jgi:Pyrimidine dimer DNA glycosylase